MHAVLDKAVELHLGKGRQLAVLPQQHVVDARDEQRLPVPRARQMQGIHHRADADAEQGIEHAVQDINVGLLVPDVVHGDA